MKPVIQISHRTINTIILLVVVIALIGAGYLLLHRHPALLSQIITRFEGASPTQTAPQFDPDAQAAVKALTAFYTLDYTESLDQWQERVCAMTTPDGCQLIQTLFAPTVRKVVEANQVKTGCIVQAARLVEDKGETRIWSLEVTLEKPWPGEKPTMQVYTEVAQTNGTWLLNRILFDQETTGFTTPTSTPTP